MDESVRIRLEGRLESVERATSLLELALAEVRSGQWEYVGHVLDEVQGAPIVGATRAVQAMARTEVALQPTLRRLERARARVERAIAREARRRGVPRGPEREQVEAMAADRVLYEGRVASPAKAFVLPLAGLLGLAAAVTWHQPLGWLAPALIGGFLSVVGLVYAGSRFVLLTADRLVVDRLVLPMKDIVRVTTEGEVGSRPWPYALRIGTKAFVHAIQLPWIPQELIDGLARRGVEIQRYEWPFDGQHLNRQPRFKS